MATTTIIPKKLTGDALELAAGRMRRQVHEAFCPLRGKLNLTWTHYRTALPWHSEDEPAALADPKRWTQKALAEVFGVQRSTVAMWRLFEETKDGVRIVNVDNTHAPDARTKVPANEKKVIADRVTGGETNLRRDSPEANVKLIRV